MSRGPDPPLPRPSGQADPAFDAAARPWAPHQAIVANALEATGARLAVLVRLDAATQTLRTVAWAGQHTATVQRAFAAVQAAFPGFDPFRVTTRVDVNPTHASMFAERRSVSGPLLELCAGVVDRRILQIGVSVIGIRHAYMCPLLVGGEPEGSLTFMDWHPPDERRRHTFEGFARQVALTLENTRLLDVLRQQMGQLQASEARLRLALAAGAMSWLEWDIPANRLVYCDTLGPVFGLAPGEAHATLEDFLSTVHPDDRAALARALDSAVRDRAGYRLEFRVVWPDGTLRWVASAGRVHTDEAGQPARLIGIARDVTAQKQAEATLRAVQQTEDQLAGILLAAREVGHLLNNDLQVPIGLLEVLQGRPELAPAGRDMAGEALAWIETARDHVRQLQRVVRVATKDTPLGPALDLERSTQPVSPC
jgi:PAS domain S-box-containing protein